MHAESSKRWWRILTIVIPFLALTGCGEGDGPTSITNVAVEPLNLPPGFCDPINFEIECEGPAIIWFGGGQTVVIDNPDKSGINTSDGVARMQKFFDQPFGGTRLNPLEVPVDFSAGEAYKIKVWSERQVRVLFKLEETNDGTLGIGKEMTHNGGSDWEELCFDFTGQTPANTIGLTIIFDNDDPGGAIGGVFSGDWTFYYDDITQVESCSDTAPTGIVSDVKLYDPTATPVIPEDVEVTAFDSQSVINDMYADDTSYSPVLAVSSGVGYDANVAQVGFIGFDPGFVTFYETLDFKVKGLPNVVLFVSLYEGGEPLRINLSSSGLSEALGDGWYQVSIPISSFTGRTSATGIVFESDDTAPMPFTFFMTDIGFSEGDDGGGGTGTGSLVPDATILEADGSTADLTSTFTGFDSGTGTAIVADSTYAQALEVTVADAYDPGVLNLAQLFITELSSLDSYDEFLFKVKGLTDNNLVMKIEPPAGGTSVAIDLSAPGAGITVEELSDGWSQVVVSLAQFGDLSSANLVILQTLDNAYALGDTFLLTDIGFNTPGGGGSGGGGGDPTFVNGDFEDGLTGWTQTRDPDGVGTITADTSGQGSRAGTVARLVTAATATQFSNVIISQEGLAASTVAPGDSIDVSFDLYGSLAGAGGVVFVEVIFLNGDGADVGGRDFVSDISLLTPDTPYKPTGTWTPYSGTVIAGTATGGVTGFDVSGGVVLSLKVACGAIDGCGVDASFDNVTFTIN